VYEMNLAMVVLAGALRIAVLNGGIDTFNNMPQMFLLSALF
jgi:hypothetical protein